MMIETLTKGDAMVDYVARQLAWGHANAMTDVAKALNYAVEVSQLRMALATKKQLVCEEGENCPDAHLHT